MDFNIEHVSNEELKKTLQSKIDQKTKPIGALGTLEELAMQIGMIQNTDQPKLINPSIVVFAGDHGIAKSMQVNPYPQEVTTQMVYNFLNNGAAINVFCQQNNIDLKIVDAGVNHDFEGVTGLIDAKIDYGTNDYRHEAAMSPKQCNLAIQRGADIINTIYDQDCNVVGFGEMGISNTSSASLLMSYYTKIPIRECVGSGTGLEPKAITLKKEILSKVFDRYTPSTSIDALANYGGFEIAMIVGAILRAAELKMTIVIDGFIVTAAFLAAFDIHPEVIDYCVFAHTSGEQGHQKMLEFVNKKPLLNLGMRLGEGTGVAVAYPIITSAVAFLNTMASFESAGVSNK
ncbi:nicotinate-nucleotide--dimethylbenzimidazole phosphoribosyltransferase [Aquimarina sp. AU474]|uniref:nicotinate-nucleotide--dimethylbenzimidazole phosphoribosyltransferase n=1 Tax=Aquimarina sp. AU474 TaxID=2108529 RepID=UPI000D69B808|nr:nicotinate-nucleotide--dimethylbenzimidazole phosphoribosyltransferase [Aquimarina sp. AU474]